jgi:hypothetical protein
VQVVGHSRSIFGQNSFQGKAIVGKVESAYPAASIRGPQLSFLTAKADFRTFALMSDPIRLMQSSESFVSAHGSTCMLFGWLNWLILSLLTSRDECFRQK